jgi:hypothetical protein
MTGTCGKRVSDVRVGRVMDELLPKRMTRLVAPSERNR